MQRNLKKRVAIIEQMFYNKKGKGVAICTMKR